MIPSFINRPPISNQPAFGPVPIGTIINWAGNIPSQPPPGTPPYFNPESYGWLVCDGRELKCGDYFFLYSVLGNLYGGTAPSSGKDDGTFKIPDFQGYFFRGVDPNKLIDKDPRNPQPDDTIAIAGTTQLSALHTHTHSYTEPAAATEMLSGDKSAVTVVKVVTKNVSTGPPDVPDSESSNTVLVSKNETRSINIAVYFLIKAF